MIAVVAASTLVSTDEVARMVDACAKQVRLHFAPAWSRLPSTPRMFASRADVPPGIPIIAVVDDSDDPGALGYHTEGRDGQVSGIVAVGAVQDNGGSLFGGRNSVSSVLSHEILETHCDPWVDVWVDAADGLHAFAFEMCDPVQSDSYEIDGVAVSDFVLPHYFDGAAASGTRFDWLGRLSRPFTIALGGYAIVRSIATGRITQLGSRPGWKRGSSLSRSTRRVGPNGPDVEIG